MVVRDAVCSAEISYEEYDLVMCQTTGKMKVKLTPRNDPEIFRKLTNPISNALIVQAKAMHVVLIIVVTQ